MERIWGGNSMERIWGDNRTDSGAVHCFGNGDCQVYARGPELFQMQGPPYTMPSFGSVTPAAVDGELECRSQREPGNNLWVHRLSWETGEGRIEDFLMPRQNVLVREFAVKGSLQLMLCPGANVKVHFYSAYPFGAKRIPCLMWKMPMGTNFFTNIAVEQETWMLLAAEGGRFVSEQELALEGKGRVLISMGLLPDAVSQMTEALCRSTEEMKGEVRAFWQDFLSGVTDLGAQLPETIPAELREQVSRACESVSMLIKCQQSRSGGVQAGHPYPLAYVRDMAGTMRGMLSLGMKAEAEAILRFWLERFRLFGSIRNAEGMGHKGGRLYFPNDEVEVPAYLIISAFWFAEVTGNSEILEDLFPMLLWAFEVQLPQLGNGMTGFSGDETYIAGGTLPRIHTYDGSAESTLLFIEGGQKFLDWCREKERISGEELEEYQAAVCHARERYKENFCVDGLLYANNPARLEAVKKPAFIRGYCEVHDQIYRKYVMGWLMYDPDSDYFCCPDCFGRQHPQPFDRKKRHLLSSASLLPGFYESGLFSKEELLRVAEPYIRLFEEKGFVPSNAEGDRALGYDYGLFLYNMSMLEHPLRISALAAMLEVLDETGAWVEYYDSKTPFNCRCRPWESGINMDAVRRLVQSF